MKGEDKIMRISDCPLRQSGSAASRMRNVCLKVRGMGHEAQNNQQENTGG
jgi:hypothetical protein